MKEKLTRLIDLLAERENLTLKVDYLKGKKQDSENPNFTQFLNRLKALDDEIAQLTAQLNSNNVIFYPLNFDELVATESALAVSPEEKAKAVESKSGPLFESIKKRLLIMKKNLEIKEDLAKITLLVNAFENAAIKERVLSAIKGEKKVEINLDLSNERMKYLVDLLFRIGLYPTSAQKKYVVSRNIIWLEGEEAKKMDEVLAELARLEPALQWKNAERQIKTFSEDEEKEFAEVQKKYLELLKIRDELVENYQKKDALIQFK